MRLSIRAKLLAGFAAVLTLVATTAVYLFLNIKEISEIESRLTEVRKPTVIAGLNLSKGINITLAGLRGYMILGNIPEKAEKFRADRAEGWKLIDDSLSELNTLARNWTDPTNVRRLNEMKAEIEEFRVAQKEIEDIAHAQENIPILIQLDEEAKPAANASTLALNQLLQSSASSGGSPQSLKDLSDSMSSMYRSMESLRAYVQNGQSSDLNTFNTQWKKNQARFERLNQLNRLQTNSNWSNYSDSRSNFKAIADSIINSRQADDWNLANYWLGTKAAPRASAIQINLTEMRKNQNELMKADVKVLAADIDYSNVALTIGTSLALIIGIGIAVTLSQTIVSKINKILNVNKSIAKGDLDFDDLVLDGGDELGELANATNEMANSLRSLLLEVQNATNNLASAAEQLVGSSLRTSKGMESQEQISGQVVTAMDEMFRTVENMAQSASMAADAANSADQESRDGYSIMETNMTSINLLAQRIEGAASTIAELEEDTKGVDAIVQVINDIAEQTNLLALNAAIEAARAGEQGRGFAVVADEVRTLAGRTRDSTGEINSLLEKLKNGALQAVNVMKQGQEQTNESVQSAESTSSSLQSITSSVSTINSMNAQIASATEEQNAVAKNMNESIDEIRRETQNAMTNMRETDSAAQLVGQHTSNLNQLTQKFKLPAA
ncbi:methyl-accepting chemotaxis protein [uncultured Pseudoteredinibacter sp.]|uniref:methyl-accepting chemotaxis protein n=1 Tax=uncultured Pseudoteredinibacter sp. TaxID=1641701 RepID=UPI00260D41A8|nr:methyl-accepting chemotaxis protein [uncultured Pseudoteredinibacter sp.]